MKNTIYGLLAVLLVGCDAPQTTRTNPSSYITNGATYTNNTDTNAFSDDIIDQTTQDTSFTDPQITSEPGFENCDLGIQYNAGSVGSFGVCQSSLNESDFKAIFANTDTSAGTCFVPVHISGTTSYKLGIAQCVHNEANKTYTFALNKQRAEPINGVMVIKATSLNSYMQCMNAKANYINSIAGCAYNQTCVTAATNYANQICTSFITYHSSHYTQVSF